MKTNMWLATLIIMLSGSSAAAKEPVAVALSRQIIARENSRLASAIKSTKGFMAMARMTAPQVQQCRHSIGKMESAIALHNMILKGGRHELWIATARIIVHGDLERHYAYLLELGNATKEELRKAPHRFAKEHLDRLRKQEQTLLGELKTLNEWHNKAMDSDKK